MKTLKSRLKKLQFQVEVNTQSNPFQTNLSVKGEISNTFANANNLQ